MELAEKVKKLPEDDLTEFVHTVQHICPKAILESDDKGLKIDINDMDYESFIKVMKIVDEKLKVASGHPLKKLKLN